ncbi:MAG: hypothetical protein N2652_04410 [Kiritimatiellae bacterium]|nr:hypothetical protein [Kiritimatiellia bacterium]
MPWEYNCRCQLVPITPEEFEETRGYKPGDPRGWTPTPAVEQCMTDPRNRTLDLGDGHPVDVRTPAERATERGDDPAKAYRWHPADLRMPLASLREHYGATVWAQSERTAKDIKLDDSRSPFEWLGGGPITAPVAPVARPLLGGGDTWKATISARGLDKRNAWTRKEIAGVLRDLRKDHGSTATQMRASIRSPYTRGPYPSRAVAGYVTNMLSLLPEDVLNEMRTTKFR